MVTGAAGFTAGVAINFGHELCKRFRERASAYAEKIWGLDENEHIGRGVRRAQIKATRELLLPVDSKHLPHYDASNDDRSHAFLPAFSPRGVMNKADEAAIERWAQSICDRDDTALTAERFARPSS